MTMTSKSRVGAAVGLREPDRVPADIWATDEQFDRIKDHFGLATRQQVAGQLGCDILLIEGVEDSPVKYVGPELKTFPDGSCETYWGFRLKKHESNPGCFITEFVDVPLANAETVEDVEKHRWPRIDWFDFSGVKDFCRKYSDYAIIGGRGDIHDSSTFLIGVEKHCMDMHANPKLIEAVADRMFEFMYSYNQKLFEAAAGRMDMYCYHDDYGSQSGLLISPDHIDKFFAKYYRRLNELAHKHDLKVFMHSDGAVRPLIPRFIDWGVDILNPIQTTAAGMVPGELKRKFGSDLCFHGSIDTQQTLPFGSVTDVKDEVRRRIEDMGQGGGLILGPDQTMQVDVPIENVIAMYEAIHEYGTYG